MRGRRSGYRMDRLEHARACSSLENRLVSPHELAALLGVPLATVYGWRSRGEGPLGFRLGRHVRFDIDDVEQWLDRCRDPEPRGR